MSILLVFGSACAQTENARPGVEDPHQVLWQRTLDDARFLAGQSGRPLLLALNMDGESASERIVRELYRDPAFVARTRKCVCLAASVFRHSPRDFDDDGRRIPCPRLGEVTCGEHMALEPVLFERFLSDGERIAPRHAVILPGGAKAWDLSLTFDLRDIDRALAASVDAEPARAGPPVRTAWAELARRRDQRGRAALEAALSETDDEAVVGFALDTIQRFGDPGALGALRVVCAALPHRSESMGLRVVDAVRAMHLESAVSDVLRQQLRALDGDLGDRAAVLPLLAALDGEASATRSLLFAHRAVAGHGRASVSAVRMGLGAQASTAVEASVLGHGGALSLREILRAAEAVTRAEGSTSTLPRPDPMDVPLPTEDELLAALDELDVLLRRTPDDPELHARLAKASLDLGRLRIEAGRRGAEALFVDAARAFERALDTRPDQYGWWIERARTAYYMGRFGDQVAYGQRALRLATGVSVGELGHAIPQDVRAIEALRWVGDGNARLLAGRAGDDPAVEIGGILDGMRAFALVAASPFGDATDWTSFASFCGAVGLQREELEIVRTAAMRFPAARELRQALNRALWNGGRIDLAPAEADRIARRWPASVDALWFSGYARILAAENHRRGEEPDRAIAAYEAARTCFTRVVELRAADADTCRYYVALSWFGRGMAHLLADRRAEAADCLVQGITLLPDVAAVRDGLDRDVLDLIDQCLEWRESGPSPVDPLTLLDRLEAIDPGRAYWGIAIADSALREALRADGRNPDGVPAVEGDGYLRASIEAARRALRSSTTPADGRVLAQSDTIWAERMLQRGRLDDVHAALAEAAPLVGFEAPAPEADENALTTRAHELRAVLGAARPRDRPGR